MTSIPSSTGETLAAKFRAGLSPIPDISSGRRRLAAALAIALLVGVVLAVRLPISDSYGDTDDAMRLFIVRDLLSGRGWYDQLITRVSPPEGFYMHWSRLLDGGLAGAMAMARLIAPAGTAEWLVRIIWPLAWIFPAAFAALTIARNIGHRSAVLLTALLLLFDMYLYPQFIPGRIDHHNIQIVMALIALAGATARVNQTRWAILAGLAGALGLAVGLEALVLQALIGASYALRLAMDRGKARMAGSYGVSLALGSLVAFLIQTPPWRWSLSFCDALALNSVAALMVAGAGLSISAAIARRAPGVLRIGLLALMAVGALGAYLALDPACLHGPFAGISPMARQLWLDRVGEVQPLWDVMKINRSIGTEAAIFFVVSAAAALAILAGGEKTFARGLAVIVLAVTALMGVLVWRMSYYAFWLGTPVLGAALAALAQRRLGGLLLPSAVVAFLVSPASLGRAASLVEDHVFPDKAQATAEAKQEACFAPAAFKPLAALPPGLILSDIDLGPFILLYTSHSVLNAPYHRIWPAFVNAFNAFEGPLGVAEARTRALRATYIVDCAGLRLMGDGSSGLAATLRAGQTPGWLQKVSAPGARLLIYRVVAR
jgi:hypothetical protein